MAGVRRLLGLGDQVARMVLMFQYEVGQRIAAGPGSRSYGLLSVTTALSARAWVMRSGLVLPWRTLSVMLPNTQRPTPERP